MSTRDLIFEIGCEELPSSVLYSAIEQLERAVPEAFRRARLEYDTISVLGSPRRLAVLVTGLAEVQPDSVEQHKGPAAKIAFDADGVPTPAAAGFARGKGVPVESLEVVDDEGGAYVWATVESAGAPATEVLPELLERLIGGLDWAKSMRWGDGDARFPRPVRWLLALFGGEVVPVRFAGLTAGSMTRGHRFLAPGEVPIAAAEEYVGALEAACVLVDQNTRAHMLREQIEVVAAEQDGSAVVPEKTFAEVVNLVEWPTVAAGRFDEEFLEVPREILEHAMESHQRYFPLQDAAGNLAAAFIVAHNGDPERTAGIVAGHERVIRARLADAAFFYREDLATPLEGWLPKLEHVVFQEKLGTLADKTARITRLATRLAEMVGAGADETAQAVRAAHLAKADLVTSAVIEFTDLQGVMGRYYAEASGETPEVALAIEEHYRPRFSDDAPPSTRAGRIVAIADKADTICGIFAAGLAPKGSSDPFALRRSAIGILAMALDDMPVRLDELISEALAGYGSLAEEQAEETGAAIKVFFIARLQGILQDRGYSHDVVEAVLASESNDPADVLARAEALKAASEQAPEVFENLSVAYKRAANLAREAEPVFASELAGEHEITLDHALRQAEGTVRSLMSGRDYDAVLAAFSAMREPIDAFFENVLVMDEDLAVRANRLGLLARFVALFALFADLSRLAK